MCQSSGLLRSLLEAVVGKLEASKGPHELKSCAALRLSSPMRCCVELRRGLPCENGFSSREDFDVLAQAAYLPLELGDLGLLLRSQSGSLTLVDIGLLDPAVHVLSCWHLDRANVRP
jgi:hypothetical protein